MQVSAITGASVNIYWPDDDGGYSGIVESHDINTNIHTIHSDDSYRKQVASTEQVYKLVSSPKKSRRLQK